MSSFYVNLPTLEDVKAFSRLANQIECEIDVCTGRYVVNAKSIMGLFSIDREGPVKVEFHGSDSQCDAFRQGLGALVTQPA
ncbi:MAG TPA: HPr family phosphocarrier protein [Candidatus Flavonifractor merdigallinarum]|uniref:HPr family phosphocarrier protein n=1 Tax=Candidatus Flavonifractor merdigallinarum TaxID=2838589 RepID=A0A9D1Y715_9FIRM|nr:HPr family phosphocarrier protein [Candidatus Flavonifractor merdigallinarum]